MWFWLSFNLFYIHKTNLLTTNINLVRTVEVNAYLMHINVSWKKNTYLKTYYIFSLDLYLYLVFMIKYPVKQTFYSNREIHVNHWITLLQLFTGIVCIWLQNYWLQNYLQLCVIIVWTRLVGPMYLFCKHDFWKNTL